MYKHEALAANDEYRRGANKKLIKVLNIYFKINKLGRPTYLSTEKEVFVVAAVEI